MRIVNIIVVYNQDHSKVLMCLRTKNPYKGLYNFVGGKLEGDETRLESAYRELYEETGINEKDITLQEGMRFIYTSLDYELFIAYGTLEKEVPLVVEKNPLEWISVKENFLDKTRFAGDGNIQHILDVLAMKSFDF